MAIVKFVSDKTCQIFIDKEYSGEVNIDSILKLTLEPGGYLIEVKDKDEHLHKKYNLVINATDNQLLQDVSYGEQSLDDAINQLKNDPLLEFHCNRASFCYNGLYGYINKRFEVVIPAIYTVANKFKDDKAFVVREFTEGKKATLIDEDGNMYFNRWFDYIGESDATILLGVDNKIIVYSKTKYEKTDEYYNAGYNFKHPLVPVFKKDGVDELYGFIDSDAKEVVPLLYDKVWNFDNSGMAKVFFMGIHGTIDDKSFTLDSNFFSGKVNSINDFVCSELIDSFSFNQTYVSDRVYKTVTPNRIDGKWILNINTYDTCDSSQNEVIQIECEKILYIGEGCCIYRIENVTHVVYLATGENFVFQVNYLLPANGCIRGSGYDEYYPDTFITRKNGKYGLINKNGNVIFPNVYDYITPIQPNYFVDIYTKLPVFAIMQSGNYFSIANLSDGKIYLPFDFDKIEHINRGLFFRNTLFVLRKSNCYQLFSTNQAHQ